jgi:endonuclease VIII
VHPAQVPEGDSLHRIAQALQPLVGERVAASSPARRGQATGVARAVDGHVLEEARAVGKHLVLRFDGGLTVRSHLRMTGRWRVLGPGAPVQGVPWLVLETPRGTAVQTGGPVLTLDPGALRRLGPDLLDVDVALDALVDRLRLAAPGRPLAEALQDQALVAGIGNMWASEALWAAGVHPLLPVGSVTDAELGEILAWARTAMGASVTGRRPAAIVYRRAGRSCPRCGGTITASGVGDANRTAYRCDGCQRL